MDLLAPDWDPRGPGVRAAKGKERGVFVTPRSPAPLTPQARGAVSTPAVSPPQLQPLVAPQFAHL
jgi:hypothetical protein